MRLRGVQAALFGFVLICFLLPFATASCGDPGAGPFGEDTGEDVDEQPPIEFAGYELVVGKPVPEEVVRGFALDSTDDVSDDFRFAREPFAILMLMAAATGFGLTLLGKTWWARGGAIAGGIGCLAAILLGLAPAAHALIMFRLHWQIGYWLSLCLFLAAAVVAVISLRLERERPPPDRSAPGPASGARSATRPP